MGRLPLRRAGKRKHSSELLVLQEGVGKLISELFAFPEGVGKLACKLFVFPEDKTDIQLMQPLRISRSTRKKEMPL